MREIDFQLRTVIAELSPAKSKEELAYVLKAADSAELLPSMQAAEEALATLGRSVEGDLTYVACSATDATTQRVARVMARINAAQRPV